MLKRFILFITVAVATLTLDVSTLDGMKKRRSSRLLQNKKRKRPNNVTTTKTTNTRKQKRRKKTKKETPSVKIINLDPNESNSDDDCMIIEDQSTTIETNTEKRVNKIWKNYQEALDNIAENDQITTNDQEELYNYLLHLSQLNKQKLNDAKKDLLKRSDKNKINETLHRYLKNEIGQLIIKYEDTESMNDNSSDVVDEDQSSLQLQPTELPGIVTTTELTTEEEKALENPEVSAIAKFVVKSTQILHQDAKNNGEKIEKNGKKIDRNLIEVIRAANKKADEIIEKNKEENEKHANELKQKLETQAQQLKHIDEKVDPRPDTVAEALLYFGGPFTLTYITGFLSFWPSIFISGGYYAYAKRDSMPNWMKELIHNKLLALQNKSNNAETQDDGKEKKDKKTQ